MIEEKIIEKLKNEKQALSKDLAIALNCLRFYSNKINWKVTKRKDIDSNTYYSSDMAEDNGVRARMTLGAIFECREELKKKALYQALYFYSKQQLDKMGYKIISPLKGKYAIALAPHDNVILYTFAGKSNSKFLNFTPNLQAIKFFDSYQHAWIAVCSFVNQNALIIKNKKMEG